MIIKKLVSMPGSPFVLKMEQKPLNSAQKERALQRLQKLDDIYWQNVFKILIETASTDFEGFPPSLQRNLTTLHQLRWMNVAIIPSEIDSIRTVIDMQISKTVLPQVENSLKHKDDWSVQALQVISAYESISTPFKLAEKLEESPYVRFHIKRAKIIWNVQQYKTVLYTPKSNQNRAFIELGTHTIDMTIEHFLLFKKGGKRNGSEKMVVIEDVDTKILKSFSRHRLNREANEQGLSGNKELRNYTRCFDVEEYKVLAAHRPDGILNIYELKNLFSQAGCDFYNYSPVRLLLANLGVLQPDTYKVLNPFSTLKACSDWLEAFAGKDMATPVAPKLFQALIDIKKIYDELDGDHIQYDHIPQSAAVVDSQITHLKSTGWNSTKDAEKKERKAIHDRSLSIAIPKWLHLNGETFGSKLGTDSTASLPQLLLRDVSSEWNAWINPGKHSQNKADLHIQDLEALGAYRYLAKRFTKVYSLHQTPFQPWEPTLTEIDQFFTSVLKKLSQS